MTYQEHIEQLAAEHGVELNYVESMWDASSSVIEREVRIPRPTDSTAYWVALHELGHAIREHGLPRPDVVLTSETEAWKWALDHAAFPLDHLGRAAILGGLGAHASSPDLAPPKPNAALAHVLLSAGRRPELQLLGPPPAHVRWDYERETYEGWEKLWRFAEYHGLLDEAAVLAAPSAGPGLDLGREAEQLLDLRVG